MVMFHPEIPYAEAQRRGALQTALLNELTAGTASLSDIDLSRIAALVQQRLR
jgi:hypothetical protein